MGAAQLLATAAANHISQQLDTNTNTANYTTQYHTQEHVMLITWNFIHPTALLGFGTGPDN